MKAKFLYILILFMTACSSVKEKTIKIQKDSISRGDVNKTLYSTNKKDSSLSTIQYAYFTELDSTYKDSINKRIANFTTLSTHFKPFKSNELRLSSLFFKAQLDSFAAICKLEQPFESRHLWEVENYIEIDVSKKSIVQLQLTNWSYTGGAHGNGSTITYIVDRKTGNTLNLYDMFHYTDRLTKIAEKYFRALYSLEENADLEESGFWFENNRFHLNNNFSIVGENIVFLYNSYEIAPYSLGQTVLEIPISEINKLIKVEL